PRLPALHLAGAAAPLQVRAHVLPVCGAGDPPLRHTPRAGARGLAAAALQSVQPRRFRSGRGAAPVPDGPGLRAARARPPVMLPTANIQSIFQPLIDALESVMLFFHDNIGFSWGFSIIFLTIVVRAALIPLTFKQIRSMQAMQRVAPQLKELQSKYKDDKQRQQQETMKFYQENKINPFASCLPLALQMPVFISLFYMLRKDLRHDICPAINPPQVSNPKPCGASEASQFFFIPDITNTAHGGVLITLLVLYVGSQLLSSIFMSTTADRNQRLIMMGLPFFFVPFVIRFPAGLLVYWITTNLWTVGQGLVI